MLVDSMLNINTSSSLLMFILWGILLFTKSQIKRDEGEFFTKTCPVNNDGSLCHDQVDFYKYIFFSSFEVMKDPGLRTLTKLARSSEGRQFQMKLNAAMLEDQQNIFDKMRRLQSKQFKDYRGFSKVVAYFQCPLWILLFELKREIQILFT